MRKAEKRSPLKAPPARLPGQSVAEELERLREGALGDDNLVLVAIAVAMTLTAGLQWWLGVPPQMLFFVSLAYSKPVDRDVRVVFDGERVSLGGYVPPRDPVVQVQAAATWVRRLLSEALGRDYAVRPVLLFPGWFVEKTEAAKRSRVWVLEPKAFGPFLKRERAVLSAREVAEIAYFLKRYIRATPESD